MAKLELQTRNFKQFNKIGDSVTGRITDFFTIPTQYGTQHCIQMTAPDGEEFCVGCTANLALYLPQLHRGMEITITWTDNVKNPNTKNTYRAFDIDVLSDTVPAQGAFGHEVNLDDDIPF